ncbi:MAG TPA: hypothetical protein VGU46_01220 [Acidobacteriaceae bacterium]|nr:hypothetical protein [Acidobacteriaceae bacterium]
MPDQSLAQRVSTSFSQLSTVASNLNAISDELGKSVAQIDAALKNLNLGITVWVKIRDWDHGESEDHEHWSEHLGYAKNSGKWGISLKRVEGNHRNPERDRVEAWLFNDAPRSLRLEAIEAIPALLEQMSVEGTQTAKKIQEKLADVQAVAAVVDPKAVPPNLPVFGEWIKLAAVGKSQPIREEGRVSLRDAGLQPEPKLGAREIFSRKPKGVK